MSIWTRWNGWKSSKTLKLVFYVNWSSGYDQYCSLPETTSAAKVRKLVTLFVMYKGISKAMMREKTSLENSTLNQLNTWALSETKTFIKECIDLKPKKGCCNIRYNQLFKQYAKFLQNLSYADNFYYARNCQILSKDHEASFLFTSVQRNLKWKERSFSGLK